MTKSLIKILSVLLLCSTANAFADQFADNLGLNLLPVEPSTQVNAASSHTKPPLVIFLSGDGGWATLDKAVGGILQQQGWPVVGWSSLKYYWKQKDPKDVTQDTLAIIDKYQAEFGTQKVILIGYSFGAEVIPFVLNEMPARYRKNVLGAVLLSPSQSSDFEIHVSEMVTSDNQSARYLTLPEVNKQTTVPMLCLYGKEDDAPLHLCPEVKQPNVTVMELSGGHSFDDDYDKVVKLIKGWLKPS
ncbi:virulence factor [Shewanella bicestrii]|uniref:Virulence factor n=1 Tax=Shewanella bicestrii TaxID=2018305 RepID=A0A220UNC5_9GAMM|nr:AcvB/VirJ family lysyl-phosphatidylglycerol hydrolase [Shewanella bicestrii]ASK69717.1 virulence factor [Shewanella bicestrii]